MNFRSLRLKRILAVKLSPLADAILAGPGFEALREAFPQAKITALVHPSAHELYIESGWADEVMAYDPQAVDRRPFWTRILKNDKFMSILQKRYFDLAVDFSASNRSAQWVVWSKAVLKVGLGLPSIKSYYDLAAPTKDLPKPMETTEVGRRVLGLFKISPKPHDRLDGFWRVPEKAAEYAATFWKANRFAQEDMVLALNPFAGCATKEWYPAKWAAIIRELTSNGLKLFFACVPAQRQRLGVLEKEAGQSLPVYSGSSLVPLLGLYQKCAAVLGVDSVFRHLAAAVGTPTLTIWGPEPLGRRHPYSPENHPVLVRKVPCRPCGLTVCLEKKHECMVALQPEDLSKAVRQLLKRTMVV
jgi:ADP-heptose:LPS heptosyltransferase